MNATEAAVAALERLGARPDLHVLLDGPADRAAARAAAAPQGPLHGLPFVVKANIAVAGLRHDAGSPLLAGDVAAADAQVVATLAAAGAVPVGVVNLHELCVGVTSENAWTGAVGNPAAPARSAGGSSGGSAAAVALGAVAFALGTDTGGSTRIPAAWCGVVGWRPSTGRHAHEGVLPLSPTRDTVGVLARDVAVVAAVDAVLADGRPEPPAPAPSARRLGVPSALWEIDEDVAAPARAALERLAATGVELVELDGADLLALDEAAGFPIALYEIVRELDRLLLARDGRPLADRLGDVASPDVGGALAGAVGDPVAPGDYHRARHVLLPQLRAAHARLLDEVDALVFPTVPVGPTAPGADRVTLDGRELPLFPTVSRSTSPASLVGAPSISVPVAAADGVPCGMTLEAGPGDDRRLLALATELAPALQDDGGGVSAGARGGP